MGKEQVNGLIWATDICGQNTSASLEACLQQRPSLHCGMIADLSVTVALVFLRRWGQALPQLVASRPTVLLIGGCLLPLAPSKHLQASVHDLECCVTSCWGGLFATNLV